MGERSYAGFEYKESLSASFYGEVHRGMDTAGHEVRILHVDPELAASDGFADALTKSARKLAALDDGEHDGIVATREVGRADDDSLVVVTDARRAVTVEELLVAAKDQKLPEPVAAAIGAGLIELLTHAHDAGVVHGAVHPRSVLVGFDGSLSLADFAVGRALALIGAQGLDSQRFKGFGGYLAAELALGEAPTPATDVFAAGALIFVMLSGGVPPGTLNTTPAMERVIQRALDADLSRRYADARALLDDFSEALADDNWLVADDNELSQRALDLASSGTDKLDAATEDLLSILGDADVEISDEVAVAPQRARSDVGTFASIARTPKPAPRVVPPADAAEGGAAAAGSRVIARPSLASPALAADMEDLLAELDGEQPTQVSVGPAEPDRDPISELIRLSPSEPAGATVEDYAPEYAASDGEPPQNTPLPEPVPAHAWPDMPSLADAPGVAMVRAVNDEPRPEDARAALAAIDALAAEDDPAESAQGALAAVDALAEADARAEADAFAAADALAEADALAAVDALAADDTGYGRAPVQRVATPAPVQRAATPAPVPEPEPEPAPARQPAAKPARPAVDIPDFIDEVPSLGKKSGFGKLIWVVAIAGTIGVLLWVVSTQRGLRDESDKRAAEQVEANEAALRKFRASQPKSGTIQIASTPSEAAVWLSLGRSPARSDLLPTDMPHQLRIESEGFAPQYVDVAGSLWTPMRGADTLEAVVKVKLAPGAPDKPLPAYPPEPKPETYRGLKQGKGYVRVETDPPGAQVWLLVGFTGEFELSIEAGVEYEFKLLKDGFLPGFATIAADDWKVEPGSSALRQEVRREVTLTPQPKKR